MSVRLTTRVKRLAQAFVMADHDERRAGGLDVGEQKIEESLLPVSVERRRRLVGDDQFGRADQRPRRGDALLLADTQVCRRCVFDDRLFEAEGFEQPRRLGVGAAFRFGPRPAFARKAERKHDIVDHRSIGQKIEHLEDDAVVLRPEAVARRSAELGDIRAQHFDNAVLRRDDASEETEKGRFAGPGGADEKQPLSAFKRKVFNDEAECVAAGPDEPDARHPDDIRSRRFGSRAMRFGQRRRIAHMIPVRSRRGLSRLTS